MVDRAPRYPPIVAVVVAALLATAALAPPGRAEAPLEFGVGLGTSWYDHHAVPAGGSTFTLRMIEPFVGYTGPWNEWDVYGSAEHRFEFYSGDAVDSAGTTNRSGRPSQDRVRLGGRKRLSELENVAFEAGYLRSHDLLDPDRATVTVAGDVARWTGGGEAFLRHFEGVTRLRTTGYPGRPGLNDALTFGIAARGIVFRTPVQKVFGGVDFAQLNVDGHASLVTRSVNVGIRREILPRIEAELALGRSESRLDDGSRQYRPLIIVGFERDPSRVAALNVVARMRFEGDSLAALRAEARYYTSAGRGWLRFESLADAEGGLERSAVRTRRFEIGAADTLGRANVLGLEASYARTNPLRGAGSTNSVLRATVWALRRIQPWLNARVAASYLREPAGGNSESAFRRIRLDAEVTIMPGGFEGPLARDRDGVLSGRAG